MTAHNQKRHDNGSLMITVLIIMTSLSLALASLFVLSAFNLQRASLRLYLLQVQYSAESGADVAISRLNTNNASSYDYSATAGQPGVETVVVTNGAIYRSTFQTKMEDGVDANTKVITSIGRVYKPASSTSPTYTRTVRVTAKRSATASGASLISRNVLQIASSVKDVVAKDLFVNKYVQMDKNTNILTLENLTVAGEITVSGVKCSITGGNLQKPTSFTNPGQTKTVLNLAYNNCTTPPGNISNTDFTVNANKTDIQEIQSTYIPYTYAMASGYGNAGNCNDLTTGTSPRQLPLIAGSKLTNYPNDSTTGVDYSTNCAGSSGTINLGSNTYNITDHLHIRANLCSKAMSCRPTFTNNSGQLLYVFVEGSLAFEGVTTTGSNPIVFVVYGDTTEAGIVGSCPLGGAVYLGGVTAQTVNAPKAYFIAVNGGVCVDKMKAPYLGGISGKNVYVATQSGNPFYLSFDPTFPTSSIPVNLSWRAAVYERI